MGSACCIQGSKSPTAHQAQHQVIYRPQEVIIDDQVMITDEPLTCIDDQDAKKLMHKSICAITYFIELKGHIKCCHGSGILISRNIILTVAHNVFLREYNLQGKKANYKIYLAVSGFAQKPYQVEEWRYSKKFASCQLSLKAELDYCIIKLKTKVPQDNFLPVSLPCKCILQKRSELVLKVFGFPITNGNYQPVGQSNPKVVLNQYGMSKKDAITQIQQQRYTLTYNKINTLGGQSGCPLVIEEKVIGIHVGGLNQKGIKSNIGRIITDSLLNDVEKWIKQLKGDAVTIVRKPSCSICAHNSPEKPKQVQKQFQKTEQKPVLIGIGNWWQQIKKNDNIFDLTDSKQGKKYLPKLPEHQQKKKMTIKKQINMLQSKIKVAQSQFIDQKYEQSAKSYWQSINFYFQNCQKDQKELRNKYINSIDQFGRCFFMMKRYNDGLNIFTQLKKKNLDPDSKSIQEWLDIFRKSVNH